MPNHPPLLNTERMQELMDQFFFMQCRYEAAIREVRTKLEILDEAYEED